MRKFLLSASLLFGTLLASAQCNELMISQYVEGYGNNRAVQIYNPTSSAKQLSGYKIGRFSNGSNSYSANAFITLPSFQLQPYAKYTVILDQRVRTGTGTSTPIWDGYYDVDTIRDIITGQPFLDACGQIRVQPRYTTVGTNTEPLAGSNYFPQLDLLQFGDAFLCSDYNTNNALYFNGNDAVVLARATISAATVATDVIDVIGVIGNEPDLSSTSGVEGWINPANTLDYTADASLFRDPSITRPSGLIRTGTAVSTMNFAEWTRYGKNAFCKLASYQNACDPTYVGVTEAEGQNPLLVFPNPTPNGQFMVQAPSNIQEVKVMNTLGQVVKVLQGNNGSNMQHVDLGLTSGMFIVNTTLEDGSNFTNKVILQ